MTEHEVQEKIVCTVDTCFSDLQGDPWLAQRIRNDAKGEIKVKKKLSFGLVLAIGLLLATVAVAIAATQLGWVDFFGSYNITVPKTAQEAMNATQPQTYKVGPMTFTFNQLLTDKRIAMSSCEVHTTDGLEVLYADDTNFYEAVDAVSDTVLKKYDLKSGITWVDASKQLNLPLYGIRALIEVDQPYSRGHAMESSLWNENGSIVYFNMPVILSKTVQNELPMTLYMAVHQFDPHTGKEIEKWEVRENITLPVAPLLAEKTYLPDGDATLDGMKLQSVYAEQYVTGIYLTTTVTMPDGMDEETARDALYSLTLCDGEGNVLPKGLRLFTSAFTDELPTAQLEILTSVETLPERIIVTDGTAEANLK